MLLDTYIPYCAPDVAPSTIQAIMRVESGGNPYSIGINGKVRLMRSASSWQEAVAWSRWLIEHGHNVDLGPMQINHRNLAKLGLTLDQIFDPCTNIRAGATILKWSYVDATRVHGPGQNALLAAISAYNTGNFRSGFSNGYVSKVIRAGMKNRG